MSSRILVVDDALGIEETVKSVTADSDIRVTGVSDLASARLRLIQARPNLVLCRLKFPQDAEGGLRFCKDLLSHATLSALPVILVEEEITDELIQRASACGAKGLVGWPISEEALRHRLMSLFPELERKPINKADSATPQVPLEASSEQNDFAVKLQYAQSLLAKVLHNLKTSDLLAVVEREDVPRVVYEITRSICGIRLDSQCKSVAEQETRVDLETAFGLSKK